MATVAAGPGERLDYDPGVALQGKRIVITGGAGFIGTTLARRLVDANEVIAVDNLHRDALSGTELEGHPSFRFEEGDVLDPARLTELFAGATHVVHAAGIAGVDTVLTSPVRTMRVNVIGTYNALEAAIATKDTVERLIEFSTSEVFGTYAFRVDETSAIVQEAIIVPAREGMALVAALKAGLGVLRTIRFQRRRAGRVEDEDALFIG